MMDTKQHILQTAFKLFLLKNYKEVTMQDIVKETGLSKGAFYHYFKSKEQLFVEVVEQFYLSDEMFYYEKLDHSSLLSFYKTYVGCLQEFVDRIRQIMQVDEAQYNNISYFTIVFDALHRFPDFKEKTQQSQAREFALWEKVIQTAIEKGEITNKMPATYVARVFIYTIDATFIHCITQGRFNEAIQEITALWDAFYQSIHT